MRKLIVIVSVLLLVACGGQSPEEMLPHLNGYWEIETVTMPNGEERQFNINTTLDFVDVIDTTGVRIKVTPRVDGTFQVNETSEKFTIRIEHDSLNLYYETPFDSWKETVVRATDSVMVVENVEGKRYAYRRYRKFGLN